MDFDILEKLSTEEINELYNDIAEKDNLACTCFISGRIFIEETGEIQNGVKNWLYSGSFCDSPENESTEACSNWCTTVHGDVPVEDFIGPGVAGGAYIHNGTFATSGYLFLWYGQNSGSVLYCKMPPDAECEGWYRAAGRESIPNLFRVHCTQN